MEKDITEFTWLDTDEMHLVGAGANGFAALLAKSVAEEIEAVKAEEADKKPKKTGANKKVTKTITTVETIEEDVEKGPMTSDTPDGTPPAVAVKRPPLAAGLGDTAPDKDMHLAEALSQTGLIKEESEIEQTKKSLDEALALVSKFNFPQTAEINIAINRATDLLSGLVDGEKINQVATKEIDDMTKEELITLLDARDEAKATKAAADAEAAKSVETAPEEVAPVAQEAAKSVEAPAEASLAETLAAVVKAAMGPIEERLSKIEDQPAGRPMLSAAGAASGAAPVVRGEVEGGSAFKSLEDRLENAKSPQERERISAELYKAKMVVSERLRGTTTSSQGPVPLLASATAAELANAGSF